MRGEVEDTGGMSLIGALPPERKGSAKRERKDWWRAKGVEIRQKIPKAERNRGNLLTKKNWGTWRGAIGGRKGTDF